MSLGKLDEGKVEIQIAEMNLQECLHDIIEEMKPFLKKDQHIDQDYSGSTIIFSDKKLIRNVIINLISNAIKFSGEGSKIKIHTFVNSDDSIIEIADEGIGISETEQEHLFSSFFRAANATNIQGTGMGLHIVKRYVDLLGGFVKLKSRLNEGTVVTLLIPSNHP